MKPIVTFFMTIALFSLNSFSADTTFKWIFVPHARTEDGDSVPINRGILKIDFSKYDLKMLGGDLEVSVAADTSTMNYADRIFDFGNANTLWSVGNHDVSATNARATIKKYTNRDTYYSYWRDGVQFLVLDGELNANSFSSTYITGAQLDTVKAVCNKITSAETKFLVILHSRYFWMINNTYFTTILKDSIAASSKSMDTTNFYQDIYPLLQQVKAKGIEVHVFGGDKSLCNVIKYSKEEGIYFYAATMSNTFTDSVNNVIVITYTKNKSFTTEYITLAHINDSIATASKPFVKNAGAPLHKSDELQITQLNDLKNVNFMVRNNINEKTKLQIYSINGSLYKSVNLKPNSGSSVHINVSGIYIAKAVCGNSVLSKKFVVR